MSDPKEPIQPDDVIRPQASLGAAQEAAPASAFGSILSRVLGAVSAVVPFLRLSNMIGGKAKGAPEAGEPIETTLADSAAKGVEDVAASVREQATGKISDVKDQAADAVKGLSGKLKLGDLADKLPTDKLQGVFKGGNAQKAGMVGGAVAAADGARRAIGGLKKDENGKRNLKQAFAGAVETAIGAVVTVAAFQAKQKGAGHSSAAGLNHVETLALGRGGSATSQSR